MKIYSRRFLHSWAALSVATLTLFAFNNCAEPYHSDAALSSVDTGGLMSVASVTAFSTSLHPVLTTNCGSCHGTGQAPLFAVTDANQSLSTILSFNLVDRSNTANSRLVLKIMGGHSGIATTVATQIRTQIDAWLAAVPADTAPPTTTPPTTVTQGTSLQVFTQTVHPWVRQNCASCHGVMQTPLFAVLDAAASRQTILSSALVNATNVGQSRLVTKMREGHQGFAATQADQLQATIQSWVDNSVGGIGDVQVLTPTFSSINAIILVPKCLSCHGAVVARSGVRYDTYARTMLTVDPGNPANSPLYTECFNNEMPEDAMGNRIPLPAAEVAAIRQWIEAGALNN